MKTYLCAAITAAIPSPDSLRAWFRNTRTGLCAIAMSLVTFAQVFGQPAASVLFYGPNGSTESFFLPTNAMVTVASETRWRAMITSEFAKYDLIIIGDPGFGTGPTAADLLAAYDTRNSWGAAVTGRIVVSGLDPAYHAADGHPGAVTYITATLDWLTKGPTRKTALYVSSDWGRRNLDFLSPFGAFSSSAISDANTIAITSPSHPIMLGSTSASLSDWYESAHSYLTYPASFSSLATVTDGITGAVVVARDAAADIFTKVTKEPWSDVGNSRGAAWGDYDNDGFIDLFVAQIGPGGSGRARHFLYHNNTNGTFSRITNGPVAEVPSFGRGAAWGDYDNDGYLDLVLVNANETNYLFHNNGDGSFAAVPSAAVVSDPANSQGVTWVDYDNDGYVDIFRAAFDQLRRLYHNNHDGTFTRITQGDFLTVPGTFFGVAWGDYNNDGRPDLFLPTALGPNYLYRNDGGGTFTRVGAGPLDGDSNSVAAAWGDYDNDGDLDLFVSCSAAPGTTSRPNLFYRNDGNDTFTSITSLPANDPEYQGGASAGSNWGDYDNDGWLDLFVPNRAVGQNDFLYHNNGNGTFTKITNGSPVNDAADSFAAAWGDYDHDGFLDLFVGNFAGTNFLYHNNGNDNHWIKFRLIGTRSNRAAIGAKVRVRATINGQSFWQMREVPGGDGLRGQNSLHVHVGLGDATNADLVRIEWPSGTVQELPDVASQQFLTVTEPGGEPRLAARRENGQVQLTLTGKESSRYAIETSTALPNWTSADLTVTVTNQSGAVTFPGPGATNGAQRFYRAVWQ